MIKQTFINLPEDKKNRVVEAIIDEFAVEGTNRISINNIIKRAGISRGSFYQYFDDKVDLIEVIVHSYLQQFEQNINRVITASRGDVFYAYEMSLSVVEKMGKLPRDRAVFTKLIYTMYDNETVVAQYFRERCNGFEEVDRIRGRLSRQNLKSRDDDFFLDVNNILLTLLRRAVRELYLMDVEFDEIRKRYLKKIDIIKLGAAA